MLNEIYSTHSVLVFEVKSTDCHAETEKKFRQKVASLWNPFKVEKKYKMRNDAPSQFKVAVWPLFLLHV